ncbi:PIG-L family deacetylase [Flavobacteriaceae bacterium]|nr:PIG-L family deacetylase [Flavobacteriaceae bacterium]MDB3862110.1 PIG-L family deacetylase [Flavobacteriaceae bacterium]
MRNTYFLLFIFWVQLSFSQTSVALYKQLKKFNTLSSVLYVAAHPDDENTRLISLFSNHYNTRTAYLSMTRGDGGQNLIGTELRESLGLIRTQELLEARKIDGGQQFFTTANDFGYSKNPKETLSIWDKEEVLSQIVFKIRQFKPDIIIHRFNHRTPGSTHGHHTSSAMLSMEAFDLVNDPTAFPEQLDKVSLWQPKRQFYNTSWWAYGSRAQFEAADKTNMIAIESNPTDFLLGRTNAEVAAKSRSQHKSQGFGSSPQLGSQVEYLEWINGDKPSENNPLSGIDTSWNRVKGGEEIGKLTERLLINFDYQKPYNNVTALLEIYKKVATVKDPHWRTIKLNELTQIIKNCLGLRLQFNSRVPTGVSGSQLTTVLKIINPSPVKVTLENTTGAMEMNINTLLATNQSWEQTYSVTLPNKITTPYWLLESGTLGNYKVSNPDFKGLPETPNPIQVVFNLDVEGTSIPISSPLTYRITDRVAGEIIEDFQLLPKLTTQLSNEIYFFESEAPKKIRVQVQAHAPAKEGFVQLHVPKGWKVSPEKQKLTALASGATSDFIFDVYPPKGNATGQFSASVSEGDQTYQMKMTEIIYPHISKQYLLEPNKSKGVKINFETKIKKVAYLKGAGDKVTQSLRNIGITVTEFSVDELRLERISSFPTLVVGIRAFNVHKDLAFKNKILWDYVNQGGTVIVQYNTSRGLDSSIVAPYSISLSRDRVTDEASEVRFLNAQHPIFNTPNTISLKDFEGWVQERGLYFANNWDSQYTPLISMNDSGESPKKGSLLVADYGKGKFIFTGLSFFRELPAGVPGAFRLFANLISYGQ